MHMIHAMRYGLSLAAVLMGMIAAGASAGEGPGLRYYYPIPKVQNPQVIEADLCVYGGTPGGVSAAVQASRLGKKAVLVVFNRHVGGMTSAGLTATDVGRREAIGGIANEFYARVGKLRGFRPSEAEKAFRSLLDDAKVPVYFEHRLADVKKEGNRIVEMRAENGNVFRAKMYADATYEGDLFAKAGVSFTVGRESNSQYGETINGVQPAPWHNFLWDVDPYKVEGDPSSGLLWGISPAKLAPIGSGDKLIQAYNFRMFLTDAADRVAFPKPQGYDRARYELLLRYLLKRPDYQWKFDYPHGPFQCKNGDCNNAGGFSTDYIGGNYDWPEAGYAERERIFQDHVNYQQGLMWFMANDPAVPQHLRDHVNRFGLHRGEFTDTGYWPHELYVREARRMVSAYVMSEHECRWTKKAEDPVGLASYNMDSHNVQRIVINGAVKNEGDVQVGPKGPYGVSYRSIVPLEKECANLFVPVCLSSTHIAYGSIRMEPVFMILGQSAATAASMAIDAGISVQKVPYAKLKEKLVADGQVVEWKE